jgi:hypothetical protein
MCKVLRREILMGDLRQEQRKKYIAEKKKNRKKKKAAKATKKDNPQLKAALSNVPLTDDIESEWEDQDHADPPSSSFDDTNNEIAQQIFEKKEPSITPVEDSKPIFPIPKLSPAPELLNLSYKFEPRVHGSTFILHASYTFTPHSPMTKDFLSLLESFVFSFCPHITTHSNSRGGKMLPDRSFSQTYVGASETRPSLLSSNLTDSGNLNADEFKSYRQSCGFCWTDYQVNVKSRVVGIPRVTEVCFEFWYGLGSGSGDGKWDTFLPKRDGADDAEKCDPLGTDFVKGAIRSMWEDAESPVQELGKDRREDEL